MFHKSFPSGKSNCWDGNVNSAWTPDSIALKLGTVARLLKAELWSRQRQPLLGNGSAYTPVARQWLIRRHVMSATGTQATVDELLEAMFSVRSMPRLHNEDQMPLRESLETRVRRVGDLCEVASSLRGREPCSRAMPTVGNRYQATQWGLWLRTLVSVW
jgi:hypothetical protein